METDNRYEKAIQNLREAIYTCDESGYVKLYNKAAVELSGREPGRGDDLYCGSHKLLDTDGMELSLENYPIAIALKQLKPITNAEVTVQRPDGSFRKILHSSTPVYDLQGRSTGAVNIPIEVTGKNQKPDIAV